VISVVPVALFSTMIDGLGAPKINTPLPVLDPLVIA
jgi:hypothetical protein